MCREYGIPVKHLFVGIAAALLYDDESDPQAKDLQKDITEKGLGTTITDLTGFEAGSQELKGVLEAYSRLKAERAHWTRLDSIRPLFRWWVEDPADVRCVHML
jgi:hypothetical protein